MNKEMKELLSYVESQETFDIGVLTEVIGR